MKTPEWLKKAGLVTQNTLVLTAVAAGLSGGRDVQPHSADWYLWGASGFDARGCASVWVMQSHQVAEGERVVLDIRPVGADSTRVDLSEKPVTVFKRTVCAPAASGIIFTAERDEVRADPSVYSPTP